VSASVLLFSYGTLQRSDVQLASFGRELSGREDSLPGYLCVPVAINDPAVEAELGITHYFNVVASPLDSVPGMVFEITEQELAAADKYEADADYRRIRVTLGSGTQAWVYLRG
jgi:hypothetical protein